MSAKSFDDVVSLSDLRVNPGRVVRRAEDSCRPVLVTCRGRGVAVVRSVRDYEAAEEEREFMRAVVAGLADVEAGRELSLADAKARLGLG
ncbi:MAG: type II toxin-antitoxin system Phd/YefM family antitoxin [Ectothiorhodospiraceae bacterium AqS1]|nr:type II toxin-antitoxin system Phd/YefM family antitoxin [Ectothiorhodospiraceae bacterium AqS1]